jgi:putative peptide zinc metalloprotease protein
VTASATTVVPSDIEPAGRRLGPVAQGSEGLQEPVPQRAEGVQLLGELPGSGYRQPPALARREDGQLIKLTPLLYQLVDTIDGCRAYDQLAHELSQRIGRQASANDVRYLVEKKLQPLGVLRRADGTQPVVKRSNPLLTLRPRVIVSNPKWTRRIAAPFVWLFNPVIMIPMLAAFMALAWWLLAEKGLASALHQAFYEPGMVLVVWALIVISAAFHEFGHAAACRYGGGKPGVMGAGLYLAWPAFYTEVSDAYRLDRLGRLRVDLGGLYFNAIFSLGVAGVWALTHDDALLLVIAVQLVQMVRQLAPFIRADGYHIVADVVGVPDLFAHIKPTLLGLLPTRWGRPEHKVLKPWARAVVALWVLAIVPILVGMLGYIVFMLPRLVATAWDSMGIHWAETTRFWSGGDFAGVVMSAISTALVAVPILGIFCLLGRIARRTAVRVWHSTADRPRLRVLAELAAAAIAAIVVFAWWPGDQYRAIAGDEPAPTIVKPAFTAVPQQEMAPVGTPSAIAAIPEGVQAVAQGLQPVLPYDAAVPTRSEESTNPSPPVAGSANCEPWPFPFDPPDPSGPADNRAAACNTTDHTVLSDIAVSLLLVTGGEPVDETNDAHAYANCTECRTIAVAFQVILILGSVDEIAPVNAAVAANFDCKRCDTYAFAYQLIVSIAKLPSDRVLKELTAVLERVRDLDLNSLSPDEIYLALEKAKRDVLEILARSDLITLDQSPSPDDATPPAETQLDEGTAGVTSDGTETTTADPSATTTTTPETTTTTTPETTTTTTTPETTTTTTTPETTTTTTTETTTTPETTTTTTTDPTATTDPSP